MPDPTGKDPDGRDRRQATVMLAAMVVGVGLLAAVLYWVAVAALPQVQVWVAQEFGGGLGLRTSAIIAAVVSFAALIALTVTAGDGLLGEIQFVIPGFFLFFLFFWLMTAWVF